MHRDKKCQRCNYFYFLELFAKSLNFPFFTNAAGTISAVGNRRYDIKMRL